MDNRAEAYRKFFKTPLGKDVLGVLDELLTNELNHATKVDKETAWGHLKQAAGISLVSSKFKQLQTTDLRGKGRK